MNDEEKLARCRAIPKEMRPHQFAVTLLADERAQILKEMRAEGWSLGRLAAGLGISRGTVQQLTAEQTAPGFCSHAYQPTPAPCGDTGWCLESGGHEGPHTGQEARCGCFQAPRAGSTGNEG
jgi:hypothetical protein